MKNPTLVTGGLGSRTGAGGLQTAPIDRRTAFRMQNTEQFLHSIKGNYSVSLHSV